MNFNKEVQLENSAGLNISVTFTKTCALRAASSGRAQGLGQGPRAKATVLFPDSVLKGLLQKQASREAAVRANACAWPVPGARIGRVPRGVVRGKQFG